MSDMHCSPRIIIFTSLCLGAVALCTLTLGVSTDFWLYTTETIKTPIQDNMTIEIINTLIEMRSGLWRMCVMYEGAIRLSAPMQVGALLFVVLGFCLGVVGGIKQNALTIAAAVMYIFSGLLVAVGMILYISGINDEVGHGIKSKDGSIFAYKYGWSFVFVGVSFVCSELAAVMCISVHISLNARRSDILRIVPGLEDKLQLGVNIYDETEDEMCCKPSSSATPIY